MTANPSFPKPPTFSLSEGEIESLLSNGKEGRQQLRKQTDDYGASVQTWNNRVSEEYLQAWEDYRLRIVEAYEDWRSDLKSKSGDELSFALAHNKMTESFSRALNLSEDALEKTERSIESRPENDVEALERVMEKGEAPLKEHRERMELHGIRMSMHGVRMKIHGGRMNVHSSRMKMHSTRMQFHSDRMKSHQIIMAALEAELRKAFIADGLLDKNDKYFHFEVTHDAVLFNRKVIEPASKAQKYLDILARYGMGDMSGQPQGNSFIIHHHENGSSVGTRFQKQ